MKNWKTHYQNFNFSKYIFQGFFQFSAGWNFEVLILSEEGRWRYVAMHAMLTTIATVIVKISVKITFTVAVTITVTITDWVHPSIDPSAPPLIHSFALSDSVFNRLERVLAEYHIKTYDRSFIRSPSRDKNSTHQNISIFWSAECVALSPSSWRPSCWMCSVSTPTFFLKELSAAWLLIPSTKRTDAKYIWMTPLSTQRK